MYPLTAFESKDKKAVDTRPRAVSPELAESVKSETPEPADVEMRMVVGMNCHCLRTKEKPDIVVSG